MKVTVFVMPKRGVFDPQGNATGQAMRHLGLEVRGCRVGKRIEFEVERGEETKDEFVQRLHAVARDLLSNPVIEDYELQIIETSC